MATQSPVKPAVLQWALAEDGRPLSEIAERTGVSTSELESWLLGDAGPGRGQLSKLADVLNRSRVTLLLPAPPVAASTPTAFRRAVGSGNEVSGKARKAVRESRQIQKALSWIRRDDGPVDLPQAKYSDESAEVAAEVRQWVDIAVDVQFRWSNDRDALREWRSALDAKGIYVFALQIGRKEIRGFSDWDDYAPVIGINVSDTSPAARIYSIAHELGHLVCRIDATCEEFGVSGVAQSRVEAWCESFAAAFLMPNDAVREALRVQADAARPGFPPGDIDQIRLLMRRFNVSARASAIRMETLGLAPKGLYAKINQVFQTRSSSASGTAYSPPRATMRLRQYGPEVIESVMTALPPRDALRILRINALDARRLAEEVPQIHGY
jgi:Zn-dependent peptidase ImmA (M78 family)/transcriptional regulator with XRE-family HTH domain